MARAEWGWEVVRDEDREQQGLDHARPSWTVVRTLGGCLDMVNGSEHKCDII